MPHELVEFRSRARDRRERFAHDHPEVLDLMEPRTGALTVAVPGSGPLRPASFREALQGLRMGVLTEKEVRAYCGLPPRRGPLGAVLVGLAAALQVVVLGLARPLRLAGARS